MPSQFIPSLTLIYNHVVVVGASLEPHTILSDFDGKTLVVSVAAHLSIDRDNSLSVDDLINQLVCKHKLIHSARVGCCNCSAKSHYSLNVNVHKKVHKKTGLLLFIGLGFKNLMPSPSLPTGFFIDFPSQ